MEQVITGTVGDYTEAIYTGMKAAFGVGLCVGFLLPLLASEILYWVRVYRRMRRGN
jgi:hypothetical protein